MFRRSLPAVPLPTSVHSGHQKHFVPGAVRLFVCSLPPLPQLQAFFLSLALVSLIHFCLVLGLFFLTHLAFKLADPLL